MVESRAKAVRAGSRKLELRAKAVLQIYVPVLGNTVVNVVKCITGVPT
jgi:hypothetical protein